MKKTLAILLVLSLTLAGLATAALAVEAAEITGLWYLDTMEVEGQTVQASALDMAATMMLSEDGAAVLESTGEEPENGTWTLEGDTVTIDDGKNPLTFTLADGVMTGEMAGINMTFVKLGDAYVPVPGIAAEDASAFDGEWVAIQVYADGVSYPYAGSGTELLATLSAGVMNLVQFNPDGTEGYSEVTCALTDGVLTGARNDSGAEETVVLQLHEDGTMSMSIEPTNGGALVFFESVEAAQAEPAA